MSSPGSGKTTMLSRLINMLKDDYRIGEMDVDIESDIDARRVAESTGVKTMQIHNGGLWSYRCQDDGRCNKRVWCR